MYCFQLFKTIRGKNPPFIYHYLLEPAEPYDLHMTGIVGDVVNVFIKPIKTTETKL